MGSDRQKQTPPAHTPAIPTPHFLQTRPFDLQTSSALENDLEQTLDPQKQTEPSKKFSLSKAPLFPSGTKLPSPPIGQNCVQAKLTMGQPGDPYEQEADQMASQVVQKINVLKSRSPESAVQRQELQEAEDQLQMKPLPTIQRRDLKEEESELQMKSTIQRQGEGTVSADLESTIQGARGSGQLMSDGIRQPMEQAFGADFSSVKIHTDAQSDQLNRSIQAKAFTTGQDVFFRQGAYDPGSQGGQELLAHELTHVVQQNGSAVQRNTIQRKTQNLRPLSSKNVKKLGSFLSLGFYSSKTQDLQAAIGNYNKIETAAKNYDTQAELLKSIYTTAIAWAEEHVNKGDIEGNSATEEVLTAAAQADKEIDAITNQADADGMGFLLDRYRTQFTNKSDKQLAEAEKEEFEEATSLLESSLLEKTEWTVTKHGKSKEKSGKAAKKIDKVDRGFLGDDSLKAIEFLSGRPDGKKWLQSKGFYTADQALILARDPKTTNLWEASKRKIGGPLPLGMGEKLNSIKRLQIATYQRNLGLSDDKFKATPGFLRHLSQEAQAEDKQNARAGKPYKSGKAHDSIYANDTDMWEKTMGSKDPANVSKADKEQNLSIISILQRIFIVLQTGLQYRQKSDDVDFQKWPTSVAVALSHGGRVNIKLPPLKQGENGQDFINWLLGKNTVAKEEGLPGKKTTKSQYDTSKTDTRKAATHGIDIEDNGKFQETKSVNLKGPLSSFTHYGMDLPVGGLGNTDMAGNVVMPDGSHGHLYIFYQPPTLQKSGGLLIGAETSRAGHADVFGKYHDLKGGSAEFSSTGGSKADKIGAETGGMMVDLAKMANEDAKWMDQLQKAEKNVIAGNVTAKELVGKQTKETKDKLLKDLK